MPEQPSKTPYAPVIETDRFMLKPCDNGLCDRLTSKGAGYCCWACSKAAEDGWEIGTRGVDPPLLCHSDGCQERHEVRQKSVSKRG